MLKHLSDLCIPTKGSKYSAAIDLYAREDVIIGAGETLKVPLGVCIDLDLFDREQIEINACKSDIVCSDIWERFLKRHYLQLEPRSSLRVKGLIAGTGIIDLDYKDEIMIILHNPIVELESFNDGHSDFIEPKGFNNECHYVIKKGDKIAQILLKEHKTYLMGVDTVEERLGGFGSTGN